MRIVPTKTKKEPTYQVVLDILALLTCYQAFLITADVLEIYMQQFWFTISKIKDSSSYQFKLDKKKFRIGVEVFHDILQICPRLPNQEFVKPPFDKEIVSFIKEFGYKGDLGSEQQLPKKAMKWKWTTSITLEEPTKQTRRRKSTGGLKKALKLRKRETSFHYQLGGLSEGVGSKPGVPNEPKGKCKDTSEGAGSKPKSDDDKMESDTDKSIDLQNTDDKEEAQDDKMKDVELADEDKGDMEMIDVVQANVEKIQEKIDTEHVEINQEVECAKIQDEAEETTISPPPIHKGKTDAPPLSSSHFVSSNYGSIVFNLENISSIETKIISILDVPIQQEILNTKSSSVLDVSVSIIHKPSVIKPIPQNVQAAPATILPIISPIFPIHQQTTPIPTPTNTKATTSTTAVLNLKPFMAIHLRVSDLEKEVKELRSVDHSLAILNQIKMKHTGKQQDSKYSIKSSDKAALKEFDQKRFETMTKSKSFNQNSKNKALHHALMDSMLEDEDAMDKGVADIQKKRKPNDEGRDEDPPVGSDQGLKRRKTRKDAGPAKRSKSTGSSKDKTPSQPNPKSIGKSIHAKEAVYEAEATEMQQNQGDDMGNTDEPPIVEAALKNDCPGTVPYTGNRYGTGMVLVRFSDSSRNAYPYNKLMSTPIDFTAYAMNHLQNTNLTRAVLVGLAYKLLKGTCKSYTELEYNMEEWISHWGPKRQSFYGYASKKVSKHNVYSTKRILAMTNVKFNKWYGYGHLEEIEVRRANQQLYKFMEGDFPRLHLNDIEDMLILVVQNMLFNLKGDVIVNLTVVLHMFTRHIVIQKRVEDLQLRVESYRKKLNITRPKTFKTDISNLVPYIAYFNPRGVIYVYKLNRNRLMRTDELYKFSDDTLTSVRDILHDIATNLRMEYFKAMPRRRCSN
uniref:Uncharacterized protein n=1 Tax=Tanacetum cinerariifolium TaxID=118510 RepID=A0A6L2LHL6_TANCI|nr:hypothetical protein [Tanacetum cinerariifolium]